MKTVLAFFTLFGFGSSIGAHHVEEYLLKQETAALQNQIALLQEAQEDAKALAKIDSIKAIAQMQANRFEVAPDTVRITIDTCLPKTKYISLPCPPCNPIHDTVKELHHIIVK
jgi:hypothetical protein